MSASPATDKALRLGLYLAGRAQPRWVQQAVAEVAASGAAVVVAAIVDPAGGVIAPPSGGWLGRAYREADRRWFGGDAQDPDQAIDLGATLESSSLLTLPVADPAGREAAAAAAVRQADLDVLLLVDARPADAVLRIPRHGSWTFQHGIADGAGFVEGMRALPSVASVVRAVGVDPPPAPIARSWSAPDARSPHRTRTRVLGKSGRLLIVALNAVRERTARPGPTEPLPEIDPATPAVAGSAAMASLLLRFALRYARDKLDARRSHEQWVMGVTWGADDAPAWEHPPATYILPPADRFWADPFPFIYEGRHYLFVEELFFAKNKGHISVLEVDEHGVRGEARPVLVEGHHLSYPSVFRWGDAIYMTPECQAARRVDLYRAVEFPWRWERLAPLMENVVAADSTIFRHDGSWWMYVNLGVQGVPNYDDCHLFWADALEGPWHSHPANPVRSDVRCARPAGRVFTRHGRLFRPAQDCSVRYGYATVIHEIETLTRTEYQERVVARLEPVWRADMLGTHTLNHAGRLTVWDCLLRRPRSE